MTTPEVGQPEPEPTMPTTTVVHHHHYHHHEQPRPLVQPVVVVRPVLIALALVFVVLLAVSSMGRPTGPIDPMMAVLLLTCASLAVFGGIAWKEGYPGARTLFFDGAALGVVVSVWVEGRHNEVWAGPIIVSVVWLAVVVYQLVRWRRRMLALADRYDAEGWPEEV